MTEEKKCEETETPVPEETEEAGAGTAEEEIPAAPAEEEAPAGEEKEDGHKGRRAELRRLKKELEDAKKVLEAEKKRADELDDRAKRIAAEYDNFRKRTQAERSQVYAGAVADTLGGILPIIDNLQYASKYAGGDPEKVAEGVGMILSKLPETLEKLGITAFGEPGETFDPTIHNAVLHVEDENLGEGVIAEVLQQGYRFGDKVLRYAMVKTAN